MKFEVMRAKEYAPRFVDDWKHRFAEPKLDGVRVVCLVSDDEVRFYSRNGRELTMFGHISAAMQRIHRQLRRQTAEYRGGTMFDGEMCGSTFNEIGGAIHRKNHTEKTARYHAFHAMPLSLFWRGSDVTDQLCRRQELKSAVKHASAERIALVHSIRISDARHLQVEYGAFRNAGFEGAMLKDMSKPWVAKRTRDWMKLKDEQTEDLRIIGWKPGKGKFNGTLGAIIVDRAGTNVSVSGMTDSERRHLYQMQDALTTGKLIAEVEFQHVTEDGSLRHPRFICLRRDKERIND